MRRREFITLLGGAAAACPLVATRAQQSTMSVIGLLGSASPEPSRAEAFWRGLNELGFFDGQNAVIEPRWAQGKYNLLPALAAELVQRQVAIIFASGPPAARAAKDATSTIPIVFTTGSDPVMDGLVYSFSRPGHNITGVTLFTVDLAAKRLGFLLELVPRAATIAIVVNPNSSIAEPQKADVKAAVDKLGLRLHALNASSDDELDNAFATAATLRCDAIVVANDPFFNNKRAKIAALAAHYALPAVYEWPEYAQAGGLISYGTSSAEVYRQAGIYTGRILKGAKPDDLPVLQPTKLLLVINLKTAKALGLKPSDNLLSLADEVIE